jgi:peroxiredoxin
MPVTQRWVHGGLILAVIVFSMCLTVLVLGASRSHHSDTGLTGSAAAGFSLKDAAGEIVKFDVTEKPHPVHVLFLADHHAPEIATCYELINRLVSSYRDAEDVKLIGIATVLDPALLGPGATGVSTLEAYCPQLHTARDPDGSVARAYRVGSTPTLFVIDREGVIRARLSFKQDGVAIAASELINSLRQQQFDFPSMVQNTPAR